MQLFNMVLVDTGSKHTFTKIVNDMIEVVWGFLDEDACNDIGGCQDIHDTIFSKISG